jgi:nicotinate-nucleotide pyrophosphorylase (carboxylating)
MTINEFIKQTLKEDISRGDLFGKIDRDITYQTAKIVSNESGMLSGILYIKELCKMKNIELKIYKNDGDLIAKNDTLMMLSSETNILLECERSILNILQHSSGITTNTNKISSLLKETGITLLDTRKTRPLLRSIEKYSTQIGGAVNHRMGLDDCLMLKDTHLATIKNLSIFIKQARLKIPWTSKIEVECDTLTQAKEAMECGVDIIMCDNMDIIEIKKVTSYRDINFKHILIEASGNITQNNIRDYVSCGINAISTGSLTHQAVWLDFSMKIIKE